MMPTASRLPRVATTTSIRELELPDDGQKKR
jgi:hypothetical protein